DDIDRVRRGVAAKVREEQTHLGAEVVGREGRRVRARTGPTDGVVGELPRAGQRRPAAEGRVQLRGKLLRPGAPVGVVVAAADVVRSVGDRREGRLRDLAKGQVVVAGVRETVAEEYETVVLVLRPGGRGG